MEVEGGATAGGIIIKGHLEEKGEYRGGEDEGLSALGKGQAGGPLLPKSCNDQTRKEMPTTNCYLKTGKEKEKKWNYPGNKSFIERKALSRGNANGQ